MLKVTKFAPGMYVFSNPKQTIYAVGDYDYVRQTMKAVGISDEESGAAFTQMYNNRHNLAVFGINKTFIYSDTDPTILWKAA